MPKRLAMTTDGKLTYCTADDEHIGKGRCNHIAHQKTGESQEDFLERTKTMTGNKSTKFRKLNDFYGTPSHFDLTVRKDLISDDWFAKLQSGANITEKNGSYCIRFNGKSNFSEDDLNDLVSDITEKSNWCVTLADDNPTSIYKSNEFNLCPFALSVMDDCSLDGESIAKALEEQRDSEDYWWCDREVPSAEERGPQWDNIVEETIKAAREGKFDGSDVDEVNDSISEFVQNKCQDVVNAFHTDVKIEQVAYRK